MNAFRLFAHGVDFDPDVYLTMTSLKFDGVWHKGENGEDHPKSSGIYKDLGDGYNLPFCEQEKMALKYLSLNQKALKELANYPGVTSFILGLQYQIDLTESVVGFCMGPSKQLMEHALEIGLTPTYYVTLDRLDTIEDESEMEKDTSHVCKSHIFRSRKTRNQNENNENQEKNPPVLVVTSFLIEEGLNHEQLDQVGGKLLNSIDYSLEQICKNIPKVSYLNCHSHVYLDPEVENCFQCEHCGKWTTDQEKPNDIQGLPYGRKFEGMMLCDQCECWKNDPYCGWGIKI